MDLSLLEKITSINNIIYGQAKEKLDSLIKPIKSLGGLEEIAARLCSIQETLTPNLTKRIVVVMASDNGVCEEGVASAPQSVTSMQTINFLRGITGIAVISKANNTDLKVIDIGVLEDIYYEGLEVRKIRKGTRNIAKEPAMTMKECLDAIEVGFNTVKDLKSKGYSIIGTGEMGIGNTTTSSSLLIALTGCTVEEATGRGGGLTDEQFRHKKRVVEKIIKLHKDNLDNPIEALRRVGGLDIAGLVGLYLGAAYYKLPIVIDGFISAVAALCAYKINKYSVGYMFASHISMEKGYMIALSELNLKAMLNLDMRLGEGVGCPLAFNIMDTATKVISEMGTFEEGNVNLADYKDLWRDEN
ncbi:nicotinate-nucleotide--dimethylbenzimidazole phosphoribosyltransferase [Clostridium cylindrosporum]|uniref:Nicotinate-nucleotide--dimethylbenzimidazole phosphoribosyltransferase n=1 Tax=Clostridium cylindrosporum DSM 605 TaxID=1121307 RepID=A0A0J8D544_CLOCY|nr:nicotinate-nucleotide--dimethylbenzimidazole phosphoribosyltransferase [Clostridium cylindrosporum]KMT20937.1 nicotinate-nucleotide--dimethylbenzimidazole phosphoribosyltransferase CobT [Clostridium cylindrosporum DSM 605]